MLHVCIAAQPALMQFFMAELTEFLGMFAVLLKINCPCIHQALNGRHCSKYLLKSYFRQLENLESSVASDIKLILALLTQNNSSTLPDLKLVGTDICTGAYLKSISKAHADFVIVYLLLHSRRMNQV